MGEGEEDSSGQESVVPAQKAASATPLLSAPKDLTPWAKSEIPGLGRKAAHGHYAGGEPVAKSLGSVIKKVSVDMAEVECVCVCLRGNDGTGGGSVERCRCDSEA